MGGHFTNCHLTPIVKLTQTEERVVNDLSGCHGHDRLPQFFDYLIVPLLVVSARLL
jgi:hypothetical protein